MTDVDQLTLYECRLQKQEARALYMHATRRERQILRERYDADIRRNWHDLRNAMSTAKFYLKALLVAICRRVELWIES